MNTTDSSPKRAAGLLFIFITVLLDIMGIGLIIPITPQLIAHFLHGDLADTSRYYGALACIFTLAQFLCSPMLGALSDQYGRKPLLLFSLFGSALSYIMVALAPTLALVFVARVLGGISSASLTVASAYIADISSPEKRAQNFGLLGAAFGLGFILGPAIGGALGNIDLHLPFYAAAALSFINFLYGLVAVPESHKAENRRTFRWKQANPVGWVGLIRKYPVVMSMAATLLLVNLGNQCLQYTWVLFTNYRFHWTPADNGMSLAVVGLSAVLVQGGLIRVLLPKLGERNAILMGISLNVVAMVLYGLATQGWMMYAILVGASIGGIAGPAVQGLISRQVGPDEQGALQGAMTSLMSATGIVTPLFANSLFAEFTSPKAPVQIPGIAFFLGAFFCALGLLNVLRYFARQGKPEMQEQPAQPASLV